MMRASTVPVIGVPSLFTATGTFTQSLLVRVWSVPPWLSPCQPLEMPTSPKAFSASTMVMRPPRLGTSCHIRPLALFMSTGFTMKKVAVYSTLPCALRGARAMSWMMALRGSAGAGSPEARPARGSYCSAGAEIAAPDAAEGAAGQRLVLSSGAESRAAERGRGPGVDHERSHFRECRRRQQQGRQQGGN